MGIWLRQGLFGYFFSSAGCAGGADAAGGEAAGAGCAAAAGALAGAAAGGASVFSAAAWLAERICIFSAIG